MCLESAKTRTSPRCAQSDSRAVYEGSGPSTQTEEWIQNERDVTYACGRGEGRASCYRVRSWAPSLSGEVCRRRRRTGVHRPSANTEEERWIKAGATLRLCASGEEHRRWNCARHDGESWRCPIPP